MSWVGGKAVLITTWMMFERYAYYGSDVAVRPSPLDRRHEFTCR